MNCITFSGSPEIGAFLFQSLLVSFAFLHLLVLLQSVSFLNLQLSVSLIVMSSTKNGIRCHKMGTSVKSFEYKVIGFISWCVIEKIIEQAMIRIFRTIMVADYKP